MGAGKIGTGGETAKEENLPRSGFVYAKRCAVNPLAPVR
jgi:hypothetical protein